MQLHKAQGLMVGIRSRKIVLCNPPDLTSLPLRIQFENYDFLPRYVH